MINVNKHSLLRQGLGGKFIVSFLVSFLLAKMFSLSFNKIFTNTLDQAQMGQFSLIVIGTSTLFSYTALGFPTTVKRYTVKYKNSNQLEKLRDFLFTGFIMFLIFELIMVVSLSLLYFTLDYKPNFLDIQPYFSVLLLIGFLTIGQFISTICYTIASALQNSMYYTTIIVMRALLQVPFSIFFVIIFDMGVLGLIIGYCLAEFVVALFSLYTLIRDIGVGKFSFQELKLITSFSLPVYIPGLLFETFNFAILIYLDYSFPEIGKETIAIYQYGTLTIINIMLIAGNMFRTVYRPIIFRYFEQGRYEEMKKLTLRSSKLLALIIILMSIGLYALSPILIPFFTQSDYLPGIVAVPILMIGLLLDYQRTMITYGHVLYFKNYWKLIASLVSISLASFTGIFLIPIYGLIGLAITIVIMKFFLFSILFLVSQHYFKIKFNKDAIIKIFFACLISITIGIWLRLMILDKQIFSITISFGIATCVFALLIPLFKLVKPDDIEFLVGIVKKYVESIKKKGVIDEKT